MARDQRLLDFQQLVALYAKQYAPYEWKRDVIGFDLLKLGPWLDRVEKAKDDIEFLEICMQYVASLKDGHSQFVIPSNYIADSGLFIDLYEGKALVDQINRRLLPARDYPIEIGDELVSVDGKTPAMIMREYGQVVSSGNPRATDRFALDFAVFRPQVIFPRAHQIPEKSTWIFRSADGSQHTYEIPWTTSGDPLRVIGPVPSPSTSRDAASTEIEAPQVDRMPRWFNGIPGLRKARIQPIRAVKGFGSLTPSFSLPTGFVQRLGRAGRDSILSGTFNASGKRIGFIRIPEFYLGGASSALALSQMVQEAQFLERNTDGLIVDVMRNPGGDACLTQDLVSLFMSDTFKMPGIEIRATRDWITSYENEIDALIGAGAPDWVTDILTAMLGDIKGAYSENRGRTGPLPICDISLDAEPFRDARGNRITYTKPMVVLTDELSASAAEIFAGTIQDNDRGLVFGTATLGAGGTVSDALPTGWYSETSASVTQSLIVRPRAYSSGGEYPMAPYVENIGVRPDVTVDIMTRENLQNNGRPFFTAATEELLKRLDQ